MSRKLITTRKVGQEVEYRTPCGMRVEILVTDISRGRVTLRIRTVDEKPPIDGSESTHVESERL